MQSVAIEGDAAALLAKCKDKVVIWNEMLDGAFGAKLRPSLV